MKDEPMSALLRLFCIDITIQIVYDQSVMNPIYCKVSVN
ncbi:hypothetical protein HMPREF1207_03432 [Paenibacillus sp. HGH0039]|nr:hypothetical protein HMPREF1207_03432 [Paenibacillus sp. HGH0039]